MTIPGGIDLALVFGYFILLLGLTVFVVGIYVSIRLGIEFGKDLYRELRRKIKRFAKKKNVIRKKNQ